MKVTLQHLTKKFPNRNKKAGGDVVAVNDFTFEIPTESSSACWAPPAAARAQH